MTRRTRPPRDNLLTEQGPSPALDHPVLRVDLVGAVDVNVERLDLVEVAERDTEQIERSSAVATLDGNANDLDAGGGDPQRELADHLLGRRSRAKSDRHPIFNQRGAGLRRLKFRGLDVFQCGVYFTGTCSWIERHEQPTG